MTQVDLESTIVATVIASGEVSVKVQLGPLLQWLRQFIKLQQPAWFTVMSGMYPSTIDIAIAIAALCLMSSLSQ